MRGREKKEEEWGWASGADPMKVDKFRRGSRKQPRETVAYANTDL